MKNLAAAIATLAVVSASLTLADDFKTIDGKEYKNATVNRVEPDGIVIKGRSGISKVYFVELPQEAQEPFHYNAQPAAQFANQTTNQVTEENRRPAQERQIEENKKRAQEIVKEPRAGATTTGSRDAASA